MFIWKHKWKVSGKHSSQWSILTKKVTLDELKKHGFYLRHALFQASIKRIGESESDVADAFTQERDTIMDDSIASTPL